VTKRSKNARAGSPRATGPAFPPPSAPLSTSRRSKREPWSIIAADVAELQRHFGAERALDVIYWLCRCHYMIRVADAFQLPLERENVFQGRAKEKK
jgi:hypothetical protein